jgi:hypothetical protein
MSAFFNTFALLGPDTWLHPKRLADGHIPCTAGAVHTWPMARPAGRLPAPAPTPAATEATAAANQPHDEQQYQRPDRRVDDRRYNTNAKVNTELGQQPVANEGAYDPDEEIPDDSEPGAKLSELF